MVHTIALTIVMLHCVVIIVMSLYSYATVKVSHWVLLADIIHVLLEDVSPVHVCMISSLWYSALTSVVCIKLGSEQAAGIKAGF